MEWSHHTVLVTGAGGFIGSHLTERLVSLGARVRAFVRYSSSGSWGWIDRSPAKRDIEVVLGDVRDRESLRRGVQGADVVFHLAALIGIPYSYHAPSSYVQTNVEGTLNVLQAALDAGVKTLVHTSTSEVYGTAQYVPIDERHALQAQSPYSATKIGGDMLAEAFHRSFGLPVATIRPFNTYGPRQSARAVIPAIIIQALAQPEVRIGNWEPIRDFNYVADTVDAFVRMAERAEAGGQTINVGSGRQISIKELAETIFRLIGNECRIVRDEERMRPDLSEVGRLCADTTKARTLLGWEPRHSLDEGLTRTIDWIKANLDGYRLGTYAV